MYIQEPWTQVIVSSMTGVLKLVQFPEIAPGPQTLLFHFVSTERQSLTVHWEPFYTHFLTFLTNSTHSAFHLFIYSWRKKVYTDLALPTSSWGLFKWFTILQEVWSNIYKTTSFFSLIYKNYLLFSDIKILV